MSDFFKMPDQKATVANAKKKTSIWVEKYRPDSLENYIGSDQFKSKFQSFIDEQDIQHLLFYGGAGTGKTTLGKILVNSIECDHLYINASSENNIDTVRTKIQTFAATKGFSPLKIVFLDEFDYATINGQAALRNLMETFSLTTRFILTCNYIERIIAPLQSRCQKFNIVPPSKKEVAVHLCKILEKEKVKYEICDLKILVDASYPDIRAIIQAAQQNTLDGILKVNTRDIIESDTKLKLIDILSGNKPAKDIFTSIRQLIADNSITQYEEYYEFLYEKIDSYAKGHIGQVILILAEFEQSSTLVINKNISFMACICKILEITKG